MFVKHLRSSLDYDLNIHRMHVGFLFHYHRKTGFSYILLFLKAVSSSSEFPRSLIPSDSPLFLDGTFLSILSGVIFYLTGILRLYCLFSLQ